MGEREPVITSRARRSLTPRQYVGLAVLYLVAAVVLSVLGSAGSGEAGWVGLVRVAAGVCLLVAAIYGVWAVVKWAAGAAAGR